MDDFNKRSNNQGNGLKLGDLIKQSFVMSGKKGEEEKGEEDINQTVGLKEITNVLHNQGLGSGGDIKPKSVYNPKEIDPDEAESRRRLFAYNQLLNQPSRSVKDIINSDATKYITRDQLIAAFNIPTWDELECQIKGPITSYFSNNKLSIDFENTEELLEAIYDDLRAYIYEGSKEGMYDQIAEKLKLLNNITNQGLKPIRPILEFVSSEKFPFLLDEDTTNKSLIDLFVQQYQKLSNQELLKRCRHDFNVMVRKNVSPDVHKYYFAHTDIEVAPPTEMFYATSWKISYSAPYMQNKEEYERIFNKELKPLFIKYICRAFGVDGSGFESCVQLQFAFQPISNKSNITKYPNSYYKNPLSKQLKLVVHQGNAMAHHSLEKRLGGHLGDIDGLNIPQHVGLCGEDYLGKDTMIQHYLQKYLKLFPAAKIKIMSIKNSMKIISAINAIDDQEKRYSEYGKFREDLEKHNIIYINDFDELVKGDKFWLRGCIARVLHNNPHIKLVIKSKLPYSELDPMLEHNTYREDGTDKQQKKDKRETSVLMETLESFKGMIDRVDKPTPKACYKILQGMVRKERMKLPEMLIQSIASKTSSVNSYSSILEKIRISKEYENWYKSNDNTRKLLEDSLLAKMVNILRDQVVDFGIECDLDDTYRWFDDFWSNQKSLYSLPEDTQLELKQQMFICFAHRFTQKMMFNSNPQNRPMKDICDKVFWPYKLPTLSKISKRGMGMTGYVSQRDKHFQDSLMSHVLYASFDLLRGQEDIVESDID